MLINENSYLQGGQGKFSRGRWIMSRHVTKKKEKGSNTPGLVTNVRETLHRPWRAPTVAWDKGNPVSSSKEQKPCKYKIGTQDPNTPKLGELNVKKIYYKFLWTYKCIMNYLKTRITRPKAHQ